MKEEIIIYFFFFSHSYTTIAEYIKTDCKQKRNSKNKIKNSFLLALCNHHITILDPKKIIPSI
jgi:transcriptional regulatory protein LevR